MSTNFSEQELLRRQKLVELKNLGIDPYPADEFKVNANALDIKDNYERDKLNYKDISIAGRLMSIRDMGKACFAVIQDATGRLQIYVRKDDICPDEDKTLYDTVWKKLIDIGDIIGLQGYVFTTKTGEISLHVTSLKILSKALKPLPIVKTDDSGNSFDEVSDPEFRFRQRYVDLIINPQVRDTFRKRTQIMNSIRTTLNNAGLLEVETPILQSIPG
ncbi:MAG: lysine--tRNA ligase, partial [Bacteroidetes bacterium]|nr:lysine--tRNA ligase [Bacteroidota bacterium]